MRTVDNTYVKWHENRIDELEKENEQLKQTLKKHQTLFRAYRKARNRMDYAVGDRGRLRSFGIAVDGDKNARIWQKYNRLVAKIDHRFHGKKACYLCSGSGFHFDWCRLENKSGVIGMRELE